MAYITINDLYNVIDQVNVTQMFCDFGQQQLDANAQTIINNLLQFASDTADSMVSSIYSIPFTPPVPQKIQKAALIFAVEMCYQRRLTPLEKNPFKEQADYWRKELMMINSGQLSLDSTSMRDVNPIVASTYPTRNNTNIF